MSGKGGGIFSCLKRTVREIASEYWLAEISDLVVRLLLLKLLAALMGESVLSKQVALRLADAIFFAVAKRAQLFQVAMRWSLPLFKLAIRWGSALSELSMRWNSQLSELSARWSAQLLEQATGLGIWPREELLMPRPT